MIMHRLGIDIYLCVVYNHLHVHVYTVLVNTFMQYLAFSSNLSHVVLRAIEIANGVDMVSH